MPFIDGDAPSKPKKVKAKHERDGCYLTWKAPKGKGWQDEAHRYVVYRFLPGEPLDTDDPSKIVGMPYDNRLRLDYKDGRTKYIYVVTALDRMSNESTGKKKKVKL